MNYKHPGLTHTPQSDEETYSKAEVEELIDAAECLLCDDDAYDYRERLYNAIAPLKAQREQPVSDMPVRIWALELCNHMGCTRKDVSENDNYTKYYRGDLVRELKSLLSQVHIGQDNNQNDWLYPETGESDWIIARDKAIAALEGGSDE